MTTYYFHFVDGTDVLLDPDGRDLDPDSVAIEALAEARAIIAADAKAGHIYLDQQIEVYDATGRLIHKIAFEDAVTVTHLTVRQR